MCGEAYEGLYAASGVSRGLGRLSARCVEAVWECGEAVRCRKTVFRI